MSKVVLDLDWERIPEKCSACRFHSTDMFGRYCRAKIEYKRGCTPPRAIQLYDRDGYKNIKKPSWCPLKELPNKKEENYASDIERYAPDVSLRYAGFIDGWNACLAEIKGEK